MIKKVSGHSFLGMRIKEAVDSTGKNQADFAREIGVEPAHLTRWIKGRVAPSYKILIKIGHSTKVSLDWLLTGVAENVVPLQAGNLVEVSRHERPYVEQLLKILRSDDELIKSAIIPNLNAFSERLVEQKAAKKKKE